MKRVRNDNKCSDHDLKKARCNESFCCSKQSFTTVITLSKNAIPLSVEGMEQVRERLMKELDPHLQANLLIKYSTYAISPSAKTKTAIDFLFGFLQRHQNSASGKFFELYLDQAYTLTEF
jgi:hypothetical protein